MTVLFTGPALSRRWEKAEIRRAPGGRRNTSLEHGNDPLGGVAVPQRRPPWSRWAVERLGGGVGDGTGIEADEPVRALGDGDRALGVFPRQHQGTPSAVVSSCTRPRVGQNERRALLEGHEVEIAKGLNQAQPVDLIGEASGLEAHRVRGWTGNTRGRRAATSARAPTTRARRPDHRPALDDATSPARRRRRARSAGRCSTSAMRSTVRNRVSIMMLPTRCTRLGSTPSAASCRSASDDGVKSQVASESTTTRLISSGMERSKLRSPASTWPTGAPPPGGDEGAGHG